MVTVGLAIFMTVVDQTIVNVALPTMSADLQVDASSSVWIVNAYQVAIMLTLLPCRLPATSSVTSACISGACAVYRRLVGMRAVAVLLVLTLMRVIGLRRCRR